MDTLIHPDTYESGTVGSPYRLKRFSHGRRFTAALALAAVQPGESVLDFGTGNARFPRMIAREVPSARITAFEPITEQLDRARDACAHDPTVVVTDTLPAGAVYDVVTCLEVLEHFEDGVIAGVVAQLRDALAPGGHLVVSVPIEVGVAGALKNVARAALKQSMGATWRELWRAFRSQPVERPFYRGYTWTHIGFNFATLPPIFSAAGLVIERTTYSPMPALGPLVNSQVLWRLRRA